MNSRLVLDFLRDLNQHNDREWFQSQAERWQEVREEFRQFVESLLDGLASTAPDWAQHSAADCIFRIHRDLRFSKNKTPYKTNVSASLGANGKSVHDPGFYVSLEPGGKSMLAAGLYQPTPGELNAIRTRLASDAASLRRRLASAPLRRVFPDGLNGDRSKSVRGIPPDHPNFDLIQVKSFIVWREFPDAEVEAGDFAKAARAAARTVVPLCRWLDEARIAEK